LSDTLTDSEFLEPGTPGDRAVPRLRSVPVTSRRVAQHG